MTFGDFALRRIIRLYPLATLSVLLGMLKTLGCYLQGRIDGLVNLWAIVVASLFLFPTFWDEELAVQPGPVVDPLRSGGEPAVCARRHPPRHAVGGAEGL
jgi:peptidoglycan/LPS O-acetylase OafA/YrhL